MRTLKKTLCLVLALVMVLGLGVTGVSAASSYPDIAQSNHEEAVEVLSALGIISGYNYTNDLRPNETLTRGQAAKIATLLMGVDVENQTQPTIFNDVPASHWAKNYISYCYGEGILAGYGNGNFGPDDAITGVAFAKIMLGVIGYNAAEEGLSYTENWAVTTSSLAARVGLAVNLTSFSWSDSDTVTRDNAFQLAFNALKANIVTYPFRISAGSVTITGPAQIDGGLYNARTEAQGPDYRGAENDDGITQLCEKNFPGLDLSSEDPYDRDDFMRPGCTWLYNNDEVFFVKDTPAAVFDGTKANGALTGTAAKPYVDAVNKSAAKDFTIYYNGAETTDMSFAADTSAEDDPINGLWENNTTGIAGFEIEIYKTDDGYDVIVREAFFAHIGEVAKEGDPVTLTFYAAEDLMDDNGEGDSDDIDSDDALYEDLVAHADSYVALYPGRNGSVQIVDPATEDVRITRRDINTDHAGTAVSHLSTITADFTNEYKMHTEFIRINPALGDANAKHSIPGVPTTGTLYKLNDVVLGYVMSEDAVNANQGYAYVLDYYTKEAAEVGDIWKDEKPDEDDDIPMARLALSDNTIVEVVVDEAITGTVLDDDGNNTNGLCNALVWYEVDNSVYTLTLVDDSFDADENADSADMKVADDGDGTNVKITKGKAEGLLGEDYADADDSPAVFDSKTLFFVVTGEATSPKPNDKVTVYEGIANVPTIEGEAEYIQYVEGDDGRMIAVMLRNVGSAVLDNNTYFILGWEGATLTKEEVDENTTIEYYILNAVVNGKLEKVKVDASGALKDADDTEYDAEDIKDMIMFVKGVVINEYGVIVELGEDLSEDCEIEDLYAISKTVVDFTDAESNAVSYVVPSTVTVYTYDQNTGEIKAIAVEKIPDASEGYAIADRPTGVLTALYVDVTEA